LLPWAPLNQKAGVKRPLFLLEILIGLALLSLLLTFLFTSLSKSAQFETKIESARSVLLERQRLQARLQDLFLSLRDSSLYTKRFPKEKKESVVAIFDQGIDPDPAFSGSIVGRIYIDEEKNLSLAIWPLEKAGKKRPWRKEILLSNVEDFEFLFLGKNTGPAIHPVNAQFAWYDTWPEERLDTPPMARLKVRQKGIDLFYAFFRASPEPLPTYWEEGFRS